MSAACGGGDTHIYCARQTGQAWKMNITLGTLCIRWTLSSSTIV